MKMTDAEFVSEIRRGVGIIMRAMVRKYGMSWEDFLPREKARIGPGPTLPAISQKIAAPVDPVPKSPL